MKLGFHRIRGAASRRGDVAIDNFRARRRKLDQYGRDYEIRSLCKAVGGSRAGVTPQQFAGGRSRGRRKGGTGGGEGSAVNV